MGKIRVFLSVSLVVMFLALGTGSATAAPLKTNLFGLDGLFLTTSGSTLPSGSVAVGGSFLVVSDDNFDGTSLPLTFTYGATDKAEVGVSLEVYEAQEYGNFDDNGMGDLTVAGKFGIQDRTSDYPATAVGIRVKFPTADDGLGTDETDVTIFAAMDIDMKGVKGILNVEYFMPGGDDENQVNYGIGVGIPYSDTTEFSIELVDIPYPFGDIVAAGATFDIGSSLNFGAAIGLGLNDPSADFAAQGKMTFTF